MGCARPAVEPSKCDICAGFRFTCCWRFWFSCRWPEPAHAQGAAYIRAHYAKYERWIPMRDGVRLFTSIYVPRDTSRHYPILLQRTPYGVAPYGNDPYREDLGPSPLFATTGYIIVYQDVRGCFLSEGEFLDMRPYKPVKRGPGDTDESTDAYDTIDWLVRAVRGNNGRVGLWGSSYAGFYAACGMLDAHPALKAVSPQAPCMDWFLGDDTRHNGALFLQQEFNFDAVHGRHRPAPTAQPPAPFDHGTRNAYSFFLALGPLFRADERYFRGQRPFWTDAMRHGTYDAFWKERSLLPHLKNIKPAVLTVGGWFDAEDLFGTLRSFEMMERAGPMAENTLVMGPWEHGGWAACRGDALGPVRFGSNTAEMYRSRIEFPFFEYHLKGQGNWAPPRAMVFETGRNRWHGYESWPPREASPRLLFLQARGQLTFEPPAATGQGAFDEYVSDPARPVPYTKTVAIDCPPEFMVEDQRFAAQRPDVLVYQSDVLGRDLTVAGPIRIELHVATTGTDADWVVKLIDVYPDKESDTGARRYHTWLGGYQQLVRGDVMRGKFRESFENAIPFPPDEPAVVRFTLQDVYHTFQPGHRLMVQVQSTWFPLVDRNPQTFVDIASARESDFKKATQRVYHTAERPSRLELLVMP
jgi:putative CocE/NonD family hydrolase